MNKAIYRVPAVVAVELFAPHKSRKLVMKPDILPQGTVFLDVHENYQCRSIDFVVQHESFPKAAPGCHLFLINAEYEYEVAPTNEEIERFKAASITVAEAHFHDPARVEL